MLKIFDKNALAEPTTKCSLNENIYSEAFAFIHLATLGSIRFNTHSNLYPL